MTPGATLDHDTLGPVLVTMASPDGSIRVRKRSGHHTTLWRKACMDCKGPAGYAECEGSTGLCDDCAKARGVGE